LVEKSKKSLKPVSEELEVINLGAKQDGKEFKIDTLLRLRKWMVWSLCCKSIQTSLPRLI
jgi:hypothetical protein